VNGVALVGEPERVGARATGNVEDYGRWRGQVPAEQLSCPGLLQRSSPLREARFLDTGRIVSGDLIGEFIRR
jgi:hypothetical protein